jgi:hypothetical protein
VLIGRKHKKIAAEWLWLAGLTPYSRACLSRQMLYTLYTIKRRTASTKALKAMQASNQPGHPLALELLGQVKTPTAEINLTNPTTHGVRARRT